MRQAWEPNYGLTADSTHDNVDLARALEMARRRVCAYGSKGTDTCDCKYGVDAETRRVSEKTGCPELRELINRLLHRPETLATDEAIESRLIETTRSLRRAAGIGDEEVGVDLVARVDRLRQAADHEVVATDERATADRVRRSWGMRFHELLAAEDLLDEDDATSVVAVFETLANEMVPVLCAETTDAKFLLQKRDARVAELEREVKRLAQTEGGACVRALHVERLMERQELIQDLTARLEVKHNAAARAELAMYRMSVGIPLPYNGFPQYRVGHKIPGNLYQVGVDGEEKRFGVTFSDHAGPLVAQALNDWEAVRQRGGALGDERWLLAVLWQHVEWRDVTQELETPHRELWADIVDASVPEGPKADRWWREVDE